MPNRIWAASRRVLRSVVAVPLLVGSPLVLGTGCGALAAQTPAAKIQEAAREANTAARFGRMDVALEHTAQGTKEQFMKRHAGWGGSIRVFEMELAGFNMPDSDSATVLVDYQWMYLDENTLHSTRVEQTWRGDTEARGWKLTRERRIGGDIGLFGEVRAKHDPDEQPHGDVHFPTKTIRGVD
jgi:hypothetical protein